MNEPDKSPTEPPDSRPQLLLLLMLREVQSGELSWDASDRRGWLSLRLRGMKQGMLS